MTTEERQHILDEEHLKLLSIGYYVLGGMHLFFCLLPLVYVVIGVVVAAVAPHGHGGHDPDPHVIGFFLVLFGLALCFFLAVIGTLQLCAGRCISRRKSPTFCRIVAAFTCFSVPLGTLVGVSTFVVLGRDSVSRAFDAHFLAPPARTTPPPAPPPLP